MTTPTDTRKRRPRAPKIRENIPAPSTPEGELFHYTPDEAVQWLPFSVRKLREMAYHRQVAHVNNGNRVWFSGLNIRAITAQFTVDPLKSIRQEPPYRLNATTHSGAAPALQHQGDPRPTPRKEGRP